MSAELATVDELLFYADGLVADVRVELQRFTSEATRMGLVGGALDAVSSWASGVGAGTALGLTDQAAGVGGFIDQCNTFVNDVYPKLHDKAANKQDLALAHRLANESEGVLALAMQTSPNDDEIDNAKKFVADTNKSLAPLAGYPVFLAGGAVAGALLAFVNTGNPRALAGGLVAGALLGGGVRYALEQFGETLFSSGGKK